VQEEAIYRCVNPACARLMPRPVKFCPWCGTAQAGAQPPGFAPAPSLDKPAAQPGRGTSGSAAESSAESAAEIRRATEAAAAASAAAELSGWSDAPLPPLPSAAAPADADVDGGQAGHDAAAGTAAARAGLAGAGVRADVRPRARGEARPRGGLFGTAFGHGARTRAEPAPAQQTRDEVPRPPIPPRPARPQRAPIRLRWWLFVLVILWGVWLLARPNAGRKIEQRIDHAVALAGQCKAKEAQDELIALRKTRATPEQLERLQVSLNEQAAACTRKRQRDRAWDDASAGAEAALSAGNPERAGARLQVYTRRYGEDERARALRQRIEDARHPLAAPSA
jgi:hypothetical protein